MCCINKCPEEILLDIHEDKNDFAEYMKNFSHGFVSIFSFASDKEFLEELKNGYCSEEEVEEELAL